MNVFPTIIPALNAFLKAFLHSGAVGSKKCWTWLSREENVSLCALKPAQICARRPPPSLSAVCAEAVLVILVRGVCFFWVLLSFLLTIVVRKLSPPDCCFSQAKIVWMSPGVRQEKPWSFELKLRRGCCHCHHHSLFSDSRVSALEAQGTDWLSHGIRRGCRVWLACFNCFRDVCGGGGGRRVKKWE